MHILTSHRKCLSFLLTLIITSTLALDSTTSNTTTTPTVSHSTVVRNYGWVIALIVLASIGILAVVGIEIAIIARLCITRDCRSAWLGQMLVFAAFCSYLTMYAFLPFPCFTTCGIIRFCVGVCYAMLFAVAFVKLVTITCHDRHTGLTVVLFFFIWGVQVVIDIQWLIRDVSVLKYINNSDGIICDPGYTLHVQSLIYNMFLLLACVVLAVITQCRTETTKDRVVSLLIGIAVLLTIAVWIVWILLGFLTYNSDWHDPCVAFGLLITTTIFLVFLMPPKFHGLTKRRSSSFKETNGRRAVHVRGNEGFIPEYSTEVIQNASYNNRIGDTDQISVEFQHPALADDDVDRTLEKDSGGWRRGNGGGNEMESGGFRRGNGGGDDRVIYATASSSQVQPKLQSDYMNTAEMRRNELAALQQLPSLTKVTHHGSVTSYNDKRATHSGRVTPVSMNSRQGGTNLKQGSVVYIVK